MTVPVSRDDLSFWVKTPDPLPCAALSGEERADVAIVGGGFAGLSAAYHLSRENPMLRIVLIEAHAVGSGASGRNTGILRPGAGGSYSALCRRLGEIEARRLYHATVCAVDQVMEMIRGESLDCDFQSAHHVKGALTAHQDRKLQNEANLLGKHGFAGDYYNRQAMASIAPIPYRGGLCAPQGGQLNPAKLARELKRVVLNRGVRIYEQTPVRRIAPGPMIRLDAPGGSICARQVVLATDVYATKLGLLRGQIIPIQTHVSLSEPLTADQLDRLTWSCRRSFSDKRHIFNYYRLTLDNRIMFGGGRPVYRAANGDRSAGALDIAEPKVCRQQTRDFSRSFPQLPDVRIEKQWAGTIGMTLDELPMIGELTEIPGVYFVGGWSGHGVHLATASGALVADLLAGRCQPERPETTLAWNRNRAPRIPGDPVRAVGLSMYLSGLALADRLEAALDRVLHGGIAGSRSSRSQIARPAVQALGPEKRRCAASP